MRFQGRAESIGPMWFQTKTKVKTKTWAGDQPPPAGRPRYPGKRTRREDHALLIVRDEFRNRLFLDRVARQQSPSPLHRYRQNKLWTEIRKRIIIER
jgi:hypothetical protein